MKITEDVRKYAAGRKGLSEAEALRSGMKHHNRF
jgi:hypothetical protein